MSKLSQFHYPYLQNLVTQGQVRSKIVSMAIGFAAAQKLPLPVARTETLSSYFAGTHKDVVYDFLTQLNNIAPIDYEKALCFAEQFYRLRHDQYYGIFANLRCGNDLMDIWGFSTVLNREEIEVICNANGQFIDYITAFGNMALEALN